MSSTLKALSKMRSRRKVRKDTAPFIHAIIDPFFSLDTMHIFTKASIVCSVTHENARHFQDQLGIDMILSDPPETSTHPSNGVSNTLVVSRGGCLTSFFYLGHVSSTTYHVYCGCRQFLLFLQGAVAYAIHYHHQQ